MINWPGLQVNYHNTPLFFAVNYRIPWVGIPLFEPWRAYGRMEGGLATLMRYRPVKSRRWQLPGEYGWPTRIFQLDRCAAEHRFATHTGKELVVFNLHNSAFDQGGKLKAQQMEFLRKKFLAEYELGNYVIAGGDWNQSPPFFNPTSLDTKSPHNPHTISIDPEFLPAEWRWIFDARTPTNRSTLTAFEQGKTPVALIDFFLVSPNLQVLRARAIETGFRFSDHQPVWMEVRFD